MFYSIQYKSYCLALHNQSNSMHSKEYRCLKNVVHQVDVENEWLLLSVGFTAKSVLAFV